MAEPCRQKSTPSARCGSIRSSNNRSELAEAGFEVLRTRNLEGLASLLDLDTLEAHDDEAFFAMLRKTCELPDLLGATLHFACVARRPADG
ncbi:MAG TPA: hypothetical protein VFE45_03700 [Coriobacteriia bacterium]|nr:hypothetical protein [Coriobacteriia bacterium]